jgi:hypothetical protein
MVTTPGEWLPVEQAAAELGLMPSYVVHLLRAGELAGRPEGRHWLADPSAVQQRASEHDRWISHASAAEIVGCSTVTIGKAVRWPPRAPARWPPRRVDPPSIRRAARRGVAGRAGGRPQASCSPCCCCRRRAPGRARLAGHRDDGARVGHQRLAGAAAGTPREPAVHCAGKETPMVPTRPRRAGGRGSSPLGAPAHGGRAGDNTR